VATRVVWFSDLHLNFLEFPQMLGVYVREELPLQDGDVVMITGDISEGPRLANDLRLLQEGFQIPIFFVLGNHDYYEGSFASVEHILKTKARYITWLRKESVWLSKDVVLLGHDGWYDGRVGDIHRVGMEEWGLIKDIYPFRNRPVDRLEFLRRTADSWAEEARASLEEVCAKGPRRVLFATHIPPFPEAAWYEGRRSSPDWLPWMTNVALGRVLIDVAEANKAIRFEVFCGHTHHPGHYCPRSNLQVFTGKGSYDDPQVSGVIEI
jgi:predicted phosphohydrolase